MTGGRTSMDVISQLVDHYSTMPIMKEVLLVWNDVDTEPPWWLTQETASDAPTQNVVRVLKMERNTLLNRYGQYEQISTEAVFVTDDDLVICAQRLSRARIDLPISKYAQRLAVNADPSSKYTQLLAVNADPSSKYTQLLAVNADPSSKYTQLLAVNADPSSKYTQLLAVNADPSSKYTQPLAVNADPSSKYTQPLAVNADPSSKWLQAYFSDLPEEVRTHILTHKPTCEDMALTWMISNATGEAPLVVNHNDVDGCCYLKLADEVPPENPTGVRCAHSRKAMSEQYGEWLRSWEAIGAAYEVYAEHPQLLTTFTLRRITTVNSGRSLRYSRVRSMSGTHGVAFLFHKRLRGVYGGHVPNTGRCNIVERCPTYSVRSQFAWPETRVLPWSDRPVLAAGSTGAAGAGIVGKEALRAEKSDKEDAPTALHRSQEMGALKRMSTWRLSGRPFKAFNKAGGDGQGRGWRALAGSKAIPALVDDLGEPVDFVICLGFMSVAFNITLDRIQHFWNPRTIYVITPQHNCAKLGALSIRCIDEDTLIPGYTLDTVREMCTGQCKRHARATWYFQQLLKIGAGLHLPDLSTNFVVWDSDVIPLKHIELFNPVNGKGQYIPSVY
eukprot:gene18352-21889_t